MTRPMRSGLVSAIAACAVAAPLAAATTRWKHPVDGDWFDSSKWTSGVPTIATDAMFGLEPSDPRAPPLVVTAATQATANVVTIENQHVQFGDGVEPLSLSALAVVVNPYAGGTLTLMPNVALSTSAVSLGRSTVRFLMDGTNAAFVSSSSSAIGDARFEIEFGPTGPPPVGSSVPLLSGAADCMTDFDVALSEPINALLLIEGGTLVFRRFGDPLPLFPEPLDIAAPGLSAPITTTTRVDGLPVDVSGQVSVTSLDPSIVTVEGRTAYAIAVGRGTIAVSLGDASALATVTVGDSAAYTFDVAAADVGAPVDVDMSDSGRFVVLATEAPLDARDTNGVQDVYHVDLLSGAIRNVSDAPAGTPRSARSFAPRVSGDGRVVSFWTNVPALLGGDCDECPLIADLRTETVEFAGGSASAHLPQAYTGDVTLSADGRCVAFASSAPGDPERGAPILSYVRDRDTGRAEFVGYPPSGTAVYSRPLAISRDGRYVASVCASESLAAISLVLVDRESGTSTFVTAYEPLPGFEQQGHAAISDDGRFVAAVAWCDPEGGILAPLLVDLESGITTALATADGGEPLSLDIAMSGDGRFAVYSSWVEVPSPCGPSLEVGLVRHDSASGTIETLAIRPDGVGPLPTYGPFAMNAVGSAIAYSDLAGGLGPFVASGADALVRQRFASHDVPDLDGDGAVGPRDVAILLGSWGTGDPVGDVDGDGTVGAGDLTALLAQWDA